MSRMNGKKTHTHTHIHVILLPHVDSTECLMKTNIWAKYVFLMVVQIICSQQPVSNRTQQKVRKKPKLPVSYVFVRYPCMAINDIVQLYLVDSSPTYFTVYPSPYYYMVRWYYTLIDISTNHVPGNYVLQWLCWVMIGGCAW